MHRLALLFSAIFAPAILLAALACAAPTQVDVLDPDQVLSLLDSRVKQQDDKVIGRMVNVLIDDGAPHRAIINLDGFMGVGTHTAIVPWGSLRFDPTANTVKVVVDLSSGQIRTMAKLKPPADLPAGTPRVGPQAEPPERGVKLIDATLNDANDTALGRVTDLLVDRAGQPRAIIVALGGTLDPKRRQVAVSWDAIHFGQQSKGGPTLSAAVTPDQAKAAGEYEAGKPVAAILPQPPPAFPGEQPAAPR